MTRHTLEAGIALASLAAALAGQALAQPAAPAIRREIAVRTVPVNATPDAGETDGDDAGLEAREAMGPGGAPPAIATLNAQYAALQPAPMTALAETAPATEAAGSSVALAWRVVESASAFADYMQRAAAVRPDYADAVGVTRALQAGGVYEAGQLEEGAVAYVALAALQDADFVQAVSERGQGGDRTRRTGQAGRRRRGPAGRVDHAAGGLHHRMLAEAEDVLVVRTGYRQALVQVQPRHLQALCARRVGEQGGHVIGVVFPRLSQDGQGGQGQALVDGGGEPPGAAAAVGASELGQRGEQGAAAVGSQRLGGSLYGSGAAVKQSAYDIQHSAWSRAAVVAPEATLAQIKAGSALREPLGENGARPMLVALTQLRGAASAGSGRLTPVVARGLTLAALAVLGEAGEEHGDRVAALLVEDASAQCLKMARLNLYQCLAVAGPNYEDVFCLGQHAMMETARCVAAASGWSPPAAVVRSISVPVARVASVMVPAAFTTRLAPLDADRKPVRTEDHAVVLQLATAGER